MSIEIGHRLRQARESLGYTLEDMEREIQIPAAYLAALEAGDWNNLPSPYYARAYLRTYGTRLGLDPKSLVQYVQRPGATVKGPSQARRSSRLSSSQPGAQRRGRVSSGASEEGRQRTPLRRGTASAGAMEETAVGQSSSLSRGGSSARRPTLPLDMPEPQELGLSPRSRQVKGPLAEGENGGKDRPLRRSAKTNGGATLSRGSRSRNQQRKGKETTLGTWYTRFLIVGAILLIPATAGLIWLMVFSDADEPSNREPSEQQTAEDEETMEEGASEAPGAVLTPLETGNDGPDRYELTNVDRIELNLTAKGECWFQIRSEEVGGMLEDKVLQAGDTFPFSYEDGQSLWLQLGHASNVDVTVNGQKVNTNYPGSKQIEIKWAK